MLHHCNILKQFTTSIVVALLLIQIAPSVLSLEVNEQSPSMFTQSSSPSLNGFGDIKDSTTIRMIGQDFPGPGGKLGTFIWTGDINSDGKDDLAIASSEAPGNPEIGPQNTGYLYIWFGDLEVDARLIDLDEVVPDMIIRGGHDFSRLLSSMAVDDLDDDGYDDIILGIALQPECGRIYILWGDENGWDSEIDLVDPGRLSPNMRKYSRNGPTFYKGM